MRTACYLLLVFWLFDYIHSEMSNTLIKWIIFVRNKWFVRQPDARGSTRHPSIRSKTRVTEPSDCQPVQHKRRPHNTHSKLRKDEISKRKILCGRYVVLGAIGGEFCDNWPLYKTIESWVTIQNDCLLVIYQMTQAKTNSSLSSHIMVCTLNVWIRNFDPRTGLTTIFSPFTCRCCEIGRREATERRRYG